MTTTPYDAVLCDIDGVLRHWPGADDIERANGLPAGALAAAAFAPDRLLPAITGRVTDEQWRSAVADDLAERCGSVRAALAVAAWSALLPVVDRDVAALLARARRTLPVALASNATTRLETDLARHGLAELADLVVVNSARIGVAKPDPRFYAIAARRVGVEPRRCLFVDDTAANVAAARETGMTAIRYRTVDDLRAALNRQRPPEAIPTPPHRA